MAHAIDEVGLLVNKSQVEGALDNVSNLEAMIEPLGEIVLVLAQK